MSPPTPAMQTVLGAAALALSAALLLFGSVACARLLRARTTAERFWIALAAAVVQIALIAMLLSPARWVTPLPFLLAQFAMTVGLGLAAQRARACARRSGIELPRAPVERVLALLVGVLVLIALTIAAITPVNHFDDRAYRASRAAYWLQHRSVLSWESHNDRQTAFPFGSELMFFWPVLLTRGELPGRLAFALGVPLCAAGLYTLIRQARGTRTTALAGILLLLTAPAFVYIQEGLFPDLWMTLFSLGAAFFALRATATRGRRALHFAMLGCFVALAVNAKTTALALLPAALLVPWLIAQVRARRWIVGTASLVAGFAAGALLSGLALVFAMNTAREGHPLGSAAMRRWHAAEISPVQLRTHAARFIVSLIDVPFRPPGPVSRAIGEVGNAVLRLFAAAEALAMEGTGSRWPGAYRYGPPLGPGAFSLAGVAWLPALIAAVVLGLMRHDRCTRHLMILAIMSAALLIGTVFLVRWMGQSERFRVPAFALGVIVMVLFAQRLVRRWPALRYVVGALLLVVVLPATWHRVGELRRALRERPIASRLLDEPFHSPLAQLPPGSRILLIASQDARDYGLFRPREGFVNEVTCWGDAPFDADRMRRLIKEHRITHVLVQDEAELYMEWEPPLRTGEMVRWLTEQPDLAEIPAGSPGMRLFVRRRSATFPFPTQPLQWAAMELPVLEKSPETQPWYGQGLRFTCSQCGNCCTGGPGYVWISKEEIAKLAAHLKITPEQTVERYCRKVDGKFSLKERRSPAGLYDCIFLKEVQVPRQGDDKVVHTIRACSVYAVRPLQCRTWPFWPENLSSRQAWDHAAKRCHGMNAPGRTFSSSEIHAIRDAAEWPKRPPTSAKPTPPSPAAPRTRK